MNSSLDKLVKNLSGKDCKYLVEDFGFENLGLLKQKSAYPYEYMNGFERFNIRWSHNIKDYSTCKKTWDKFKMKTMGDYHDYYLKKDVLLLADVF